MAGRGGYRPGAGRKVGSVGSLERKTALKLLDPEIKIVRNSTGGQAVTAAVILAAVDEGRLWRDLLAAETVTSVSVSGGQQGEREQITTANWTVRLNALEYLTDRRDGKALEHVKTEVVNDGDPDKRLRELLAKRSGNSAPKAEPGREDGADFSAGIGRA